MDDSDLEELRDTSDESDSSSMNVDIITGSMVASRVKLNPRKSSFVRKFLRFSNALSCNKRVACCCYLR